MSVSGIISQSTLGLIASMVNDVMTDNWYIVTTFQSE